MISIRAGNPGGTGGADHRLLLRHRHPDVFVDHPPPHFFASYSGHEANVSIETGDFIEGHLPGNAARLVKEWALAHRSELEDNWRRARAGVPLVKIAGLDND